ncbi:MAG: class I SAM-dependent DNA methyltransferase [Candidatus Nitrosomaritimum yanchengensis]
MNKTTFQRGYSQQYDFFYEDKNYFAECEMLEKVFKKFCTDKIVNVLDLGCGTGNHAFILAENGYEVVGVDRSTEMLEQAYRKKALRPELNLSFIESNIADLHLEKNFDIVLMMFAVLGYQTTNEDILVALKSVKEHLKPGGLFIFDCWYGPAVLTIRPNDRVKVIKLPGEKLIRSASGNLNTNHNLCKVIYNIWRIQGDKLVSEVEEIHMMRYFFKTELELFFDIVGLELIQLSSFEDFSSPSSEKTWNILGVARSI